MAAILPQIEFGGKPSLRQAARATDILSQLNLDGTPRGAAVEVISRLSQFGRVTEDKEALGVFLNYVLFFKGEEDEDTAFIRSNTRE